MKRLTSLFRMGTARTDRSGELASRKILGKEREERELDINILFLHLLQIIARAQNRTPLQNLPRGPVKFFEAGLSLSDIDFLEVLCRPKDMPPRKIKQYVRSLNEQFARWVAQQREQKPDRFWGHGLMDYLRHAVIIKRDCASMFSLLA